MKLSEYIEDLQLMLDRYGDGDAYSLGEYGERERLEDCHVEYDDEYFYEEKDGVLNVKVERKNVRYIFY